MKPILSICFALLTLLNGCQQANPAPATTLVPTVLSFPSTPTFAPDEKLATDMEELVGSWKGSVDGLPGFLIITDDGTLKLARNADGTSGNSHQARFEGNILNIRQDISLHNCDQLGQYQVRIQRDGGKTVSMVFVLIGEDPCGPRVHDLVTDTPRWTLP